MEKLEPVLKQKFWILLGVAIIMTFTGWWVATAGMAATIATRTSEIEKSFKAVPQGQIPGKSWTERLSVINTEQDRSIKTTQLGMWKKQEAVMSFPEGVKPVNGYWGKFSTETRQVFRDSYFEHVVQLWKTVNPIVEETGAGVVKYPLPALFRVLGKGPWPNTPPESEAMWEVQEDMWLVDSLFQTIAAVNGGPEAPRSEAVILQIDKFELRGGGEKKSSGGGGGGPSATGGMSEMGGSQTSLGMAPGLGGGVPPGMGGMVGGGGATAQGGLAGGLTVVSPEFDPTEEFGDDGSAASTSNAGGMAGAMAMGAGGMGGGDPSAAVATSKTVNRYVIPKDPSKPRETGPFRTRGFYLSVKMDHTKIPSFLEELTSNSRSVWPIEIVRVQMARINEDNESSFNSSTSGGGISASRRFPGAMSMPGALGAGGPSSLGGNSGLFGTGSGALGGSSTGSTDDLYAAYGVRAPSGGSDSGNSQQALTAKAALENALKDPVMAQVTICGVFTLYNKVDEPAAAPAAVPNTQEPVPAESNNTDAEGKTATPSDTTPAASAATEPSETTDAPADKTEPGVPKDQAAVEPKDEPKPESKPDDNR